MWQLGWASEMADRLGIDSTFPHAWSNSRSCRKFPELGLDCRPDGTVVWRSRRWAEYTGLDVDQLQAGAWREVRADGDIDGVISRWGEARRLGQPYEDVSADSRGGRCHAPVPVPCRFPCGPLMVRLSAGSESIRKSGGLQEGEARLRALTLTLSASEARFRAAVQAVEGVMWTNDAEGRMAGAQPGWAALTGQTEAEYQGYGWSNAVHPTTRRQLLWHGRKPSSERRTFVFEHRLWRK